MIIGNATPEQVGIGNVRRPGDLLHIDNKKLARIEHMGHRITGNPQDHVRGVGYEAAFVAIDDRSRVALAEMLSDERNANAAAFLDHAARYYRCLGVRVRCIMTDDAKVFRSFPFTAACRRWRLQHISTKLYTPRTNGKAERFIQTALAGRPPISRLSSMGTTC